MSYSTALLNNVYSNRDEVLKLLHDIDRGSNYEDFVLTYPMLLWLWWDETIKYIRTGDSVMKPHSTFDFMVKFKEGFKLPSYIDQMQIVQGQIIDTSFAFHKGPRDKTFYEQSVKEACKDRSIIGLWVTLVNDIMPSAVGVIRSRLTNNNVRKYITNSQLEKSRGIRIYSIVYDIPNSTCNAVPNRYRISQTVQLSIV